MPQRAAKSARANAETSACSKHRQRPCMTARCRTHVLQNALRSYQGVGSSKPPGGTKNEKFLPADNQAEELAACQAQQPAVRSAQPRSRRSKVTLRRGYAAHRLARCQVALVLVGDRQVAGLTGVLMCRRTTRNSPPISCASRCETPNDEALAWACAAGTTSAAGKPMRRANDMQKCSLTARCGVCGLVVSSLRIASMRRRGPSTRKIRPSPMCIGRSR